MLRFPVLLLSFAAVLLLRRVHGNPPLPPQPLQLGSTTCWNPVSSRTRLPLAYFGSVALDLEQSSEGGGTCATAFHRHYTLPEPLGIHGGRRASIYRIRHRQSDTTLLLKAVPMRHRDPESFLFQRWSGTDPAQEVLVSLAVNRIGKRFPGVAAFFMRTVDWFQCSRDALLLLRDTPPSPTTPPPLSVDTQFLVVEQVGGPNLMTAVLELAQENRLTVDFVRAALFQVVFAMSAGDKAIGFRHYDPHVGNIHLSKRWYSTTTADAAPSSSSSSSSSSSMGIREFQVQVEPNSVQSFFVPRNHALGVDFTLIDFGTSVVHQAASDSPGTCSSESTSPCPLIGPRFYRESSDRLTSMTVNLRILFLSLAATIPKRFYRQWKQQDYESYQQFNAILIRLMGLDQRTWFSHGLFIPLVRGFGRVQVRDLGMPQWIARRKRWWSRYFYLCMARYVLLSAFQDKSIRRTAVTYDDVLRMQFFTSAYSRDGRGGGDSGDGRGRAYDEWENVVQLGPLPAYDAEFQAHVQEYRKQRTLRKSHFARKLAKYQ